MVEINIMSLTVLLLLLSSIVSLVFALIVSDQFFARGKRRLLAAGAILPAFAKIHIRPVVDTTPLYNFKLPWIKIIFIGSLRSREVSGLYRILFIHGLSQYPG